MSFIGDQITQAVVFLLVGTARAKAYTMTVFLADISFAGHLVLKDFFRRRGSSINGLLFNCLSCSLYHVQGFC